MPVFALLFSCREKLDIKPKQSIDAEVALTTPDNIKTTLVGAYLIARSANLFGSQFNEISELYATTGDMIFIGTYQQPREFEDKEAHGDKFIRCRIPGLMLTSLSMSATLSLRMRPLPSLMPMTQIRVEGEARVSERMDAL